MTTHRNRYNRLLLKARDAHRERTGHRQMIMGANFIECEVCHNHAHIEGGLPGPRLRKHNRDYTYHEFIEAEAF